LIKSAPSPKLDNTLPVEIELTWKEFQEAYPVWLQWIATEKRFLPTDLRKQPQPLFDNMLYIDMLMEKIIGQQVERMKEQGNG
jgi:hypothetical protein